MIGCYKCNDEVQSISIPTVVVYFQNNTALVT